MLVKKNIFLFLFLVSSTLANAKKVSPCKLPGMAGELHKDVCLVAEVWKKLANYDPKKEIRPLRNGFMYHGPSGTGKKMAVRLLAKETNSTLMEMNMCEFDKKYSTEFPDKIHEMYRNARKKVEETRRPVIILIEVDDEIAKDTDLLHKPIQNTSGNPYITTIVTVHNPKATTEGLQSRCDPVPFNLPKGKDRKEAIEMFAQEKGAHLPSWLVRVIARTSSGKSYADIKMAVEEAVTVNEEKTLSKINKTQLFHELSKQNYIAVGVSSVVTITSLAFLIYRLWHGHLPPFLSLPITT